MTPDLLDRILTRLDVTGASNEPWALAIVAALDGEAQLTAFLDKKTTIAMPEGRSPQTAAARVEPPGVYLASLTVEGFRGVGPAATLTLTPGPGLSLVVGRNGSGKSSFAEGLEVPPDREQLSLGRTPEGLGRRLAQPASHEHPSR